MSRILYVEDDPDSVLVMEAALSQIPEIDLLVATTGSEGILLARKSSPDLILLDINLPDIDGYEVLKRLKHASEIGGVPILAFTSIALFDERQRGLRAGFTDYLTKPMHMPEFLTIIKKYLAAH